MSEIYGVKNTIKCKRCGYEKKPEQFRNQAAAKSGKHPWCRACHNEYVKKNFKENKEHRTKLIRDWQKKNPKKLKQYKADWYKRHKNDVKEEVVNEEAGNPTN